MALRPTRRQFLKRTGLASAAALTAGVWSETVRGASRSVNEKLHIGVIGVAGRGGDNLRGVSEENIVALCDIDERRLSGAAADFPAARQYRDYRKLLEQADLDAVVVSTPDHTHAIPVVWALKRGLDVYCEKPLAHSVYEVRQIREWAANGQAVTQMGTQIHAGDNYRRAVEIVGAGVIGPVSRVHVWQGGGIRPGKRVASATPPAHVDYDLWTGPAPMRPFHESHFHYNWRYWWDFANGQLGDFGCHYMDLPYWALDLRYPTSIEARGEKGHDGDNEVPMRMQVDYQFAARGQQPPVHMTWYHGGWMPEGAEEFGKSSAVLFEGEHGRLLADYGSRQIFMTEGRTAATPAPTIPSSIGHHAEWINACKTRGQTTCNFDYSGALTEAVLLGNVSYRLGGQRLDWDAENLTATNCPDAGQFIRREYRQGWTL